MKSIQITAGFVKKWNSKRVIDYDCNYYDPYLKSGRIGDKEALLQLTRWKNIGKLCPMNLSRKKQLAFSNFIQNLERYLEPNGEGERALREDFSWRAPIYAIFWGHVLYKKPIFDIHTNRAFHWFSRGDFLPEKKAAVKAGSHWKLYDDYVLWFNKILDSVQKEDSKISARDLDRSLLEWGRANKGALVNP